MSKMFYRFTFRKIRFTILSKGNKYIMANGTVKLFNATKGFGFIPLKMVKICSLTSHQSNLMDSNHLTKVKKLNLMLKKVNVDLKQLISQKHNVSENRAKTGVMTSVFLYSVAIMREYDILSQQEETHTSHS
ncbi:hypothetical protein ML8HA_02852 [Lactococcus lactis]|nr:hypothetical protein [Lactococcus lactis]